MKVGILSEFCLARSHGSGAQMLRIIDHAPLDAFHVYWSSRPFGLSEPGRRSFRFEDPIYWRPLRLNRLMTRLHAAVGLRGWRADGTLNSRLFERILPLSQARADVLYAFATSEGSARQCLSLVDHFGKPFVLHIMDVQHEHGLDPATMPAYAELIRRASSVLVINAAIEKEVRKFPVRDVEIVPFGQTVYDRPPPEPMIDDAPRVCITGAIHYHGLDLLAAAWPRVLARFPRAELVYAGTLYDAVPSALRPHVQNLGFAKPARYLDILHTSHVGYVPGPVVLDCYGRFSIPSRIADFCMAGLPIIACVAPGSAAELFLRPVRGEFVQIPADADALVDQFAAWFLDPAARAEAGEKARRFAETHLSSGLVAQRVLARLQAACQRQEAVVPA